MAKGTVLTKEVRALIAEVAREYHYRGAKVIRDEVIRRLPDVFSYADPGWPGLSIVRKVLANIRQNLDKRPPEAKGIDTPWSVGSLSQYPIPPEALPMVLRVYAQHKHTLSEKVWHQWRLPDIKAVGGGGLDTKYPESFTIREALWVSRLSKLFSVLQKLCFYASWYSFREHIYEAIGESIDTTDIDELLIEDLELNQSEESKGGTT